MARQRDYKEEYRQRIASGRARGVSRQIARGRHPGEGGRLPDGYKASLFSLSELRSGHLRASTLETMRRMNIGLRSADPEPWLKFAERRGWPVVPNQNRGGWHTQDDIPSDLLEAMSHSERNYFYGY